MINKINYINNIGLFVNMRGASNIDLKRLTLIYAENGRGKNNLIRYSKISYDWGPYLY